MTLRVWLWLGTVAILLGALWLVRGDLLPPLRPTSPDVAYGAASPAQRLDIYAPAASAKPAPAVVFIHGGAFFFGGRRDTVPSVIEGVKRLNAAGIALVSIDYRMSDEARFPAAVRDARSAVRWLRANGARYGIDPSRIAVWGESAGGNLALMVGMADGVPAFDDPAIAPGVSSRVSSVIAHYPVIDLRAMETQLRSRTCGGKTATPALRSAGSRYIGAPLGSVPDRAAAANPMRYVHAGAPPVLLQAGTADCIVPHEESIRMAAALTRAGVANRLMLFRGARHGDPMFSTAENQALMIAFLKRSFEAPVR